MILSNPFPTGLFLSNTDGRVPHPRLILQLELRQGSGIHVPNACSFENSFFKSFFKVSSNDFKCSLFLLFFNAHLYLYSRYRSLLVKQMPISTSIIDAHLYLYRRWPSLLEQRMPISTCIVDAHLYLNSRCPFYLHSRCPSILVQQMPICT